MNAFLRREAWKERLNASQAELWRKVEVSDARDVGIRLSATLFSAVLSVADEDRFAVDEPTRSQMIFEAELFASCYASYHAGRFFSDSGLRDKFVLSVNDNFAMVAEVVTESSSKAAFRADFESFLALRRERYCKLRSSPRFRLFKILLGEAYVDQIFLTYETKTTLGRLGLCVPDSELDRFVRAVVKEAHIALRDFAKQLKLQSQ